MSARTLVVPCAIGLLAVAFAHGGALSNEFVAFDDDGYVYENPLVQGGLTRDSAAWAFSPEARFPYYHPLTWLSLMADRDVFGNGPFGFHLVNVLLHAATVLLLLIAMAQASGRVWPSLGAALLFGVHPLTVEAVAWVAERKTVLAGALGAAAVLAYVAFARRPSAGRLAGVAVLHALGLLAKPALVVLPGLLLVLDWWPLGRPAAAKGAPLPWGGRFPARSPRALLLEKAPLGAVSLAGVVATLATNTPPGGPGWTPPSLSVKSAVAVAVIPQYLRAAAWPSRLSLFHPYPASISAVAFFAGVAALLLGSAIALVSAGRVPALAAGWTWFLVALLPVLGLVQSGLWPAWADRYAYFGLFGLCLGVSFALAEIAGRDLGRRAVAGVVLVAALVGFALVTRKQVGHWKNSLALFDRAVAVEPRAGMMRFCFGSALLAAGAPGPALEHLEVATTLHPLRFDMQAMLAAALDRLGRADAAEERYRIALRVYPDYPVALYNLADLLRRRGRMGEARGLYQRFLRAESGSRSRARSDAFEKQRLLAEAYVAMSPGAPATRSRRPAPASDARP